jgi:hypothetical protein
LAAEEQTLRTMEGLYEEYQKVHLPTMDYNECAATKSQIQSINTKVNSKTMKHYKKDQKA